MTIGPQRGRRPKELVKSFLVGALLIGTLTIARAPFEDPAPLASVGGYPAWVAIASLWGGICGIIYSLSKAWRTTRGYQRWAAYALMGCSLGVLGFVALAADGGVVLGLAGRPVSAWLSAFVTAITIPALCAVIARKWFDLLGVLPDQE